MSHFKLQRIANQFPLWTKTRSDPSSMAQRFFAPFAEYLDFAEVEQFRIKDESFLLKWHLGHTALWSIWLEVDDYMATNASVGGGLVVTYPTSVTAEHATLGSLVLSRDEDFEDLLYAEPQRLVLEETTAITSSTIWDSSNELVFNDFTYPERLTINVSGSTKYDKKTATEDRYHSGFNGLVIKGRDINDLEITETVAVRDDGVYTTRNFWSRIDVQPDIDGLDGRIEMGYKQAAFPYVLDPYHVGVLDDVEGPLKLRLELVGSGTVLTYFTDRFKLGSAYRRGQVEVDNEEVISEQVLKDAVGSDITAVDLTISYENTKLYVIDDGGILHIYDHGATPFGPPQENIATRSTRIVPIPLQHYVRLDDTHKMWTHHRRPRNPIARVQVKRITPSGTTEYLQAGYTWGPVAYDFLGEPLAKNAASSWQELTFENTYDELGQWDFYVTTWEGSDVTTAHTAVMVDSVDALVSIDTGIASPTGIFFSREGFVTVTDATNFYKFSEHRDTYFADADRQQLIFREDYTSVEVTA